MNQPRRKQGGRNRRQRSKPKPPLDIWRPVPQLPEPEPVTPASDPTILIRSLGAPPLHGQSGVAEHYFAHAVERAAGLATALAASADLLAQDDDVAD